MSRRFLCCAALALLLAGCEAEPAATPERTPGADFLMLLADGGAAREVRRLGMVAGLEQYLADEAQLAWPGSPVVAGKPMVLTALGYTLLDSATVFWQPLAVHPDSGFGLVSGVIVVDDSTGREGDSPRMGRYMAGWRATDAGWRLESFLVTGVGLPLLPELPASGRDSVAAIAGLHPELRSADSTFRAALAAEGMPAVLPRWMSATGMTFNGSGTLNIGPDQVAEAMQATQGGFAWSLRPEASGSSPSGRTGWVAGQMIIRDASVSPARESHWNYMLFWVEEGGAYRIAAAGTNPRRRPEG